MVKWDIGKTKYIDTSQMPWCSGCENKHKNDKEKKNEKKNRFRFF